MNHEPGVRGDRKETRSQPLEQRDMRIERRSLRAAHEREQLIGALDSAGEDLPRAACLPEIGDSDSAATVLVFVGRPDTPARGADVLAALVGGIQELVVRQHEVGSVGNEDPPGGIDPPLGELIELAAEGLWLEHDTVADNADGGWMEDAGRNLAQNKLRVPDHHGVTRIGATLVSHDQIGTLGEHVDQLALPSSPHCAPTTTTQVVLASNMHILPVRQRKEPLTGLQNPRRNVCMGPRKVNSWREPAPHSSRW